jgi:tRNA pseudouridine38-40 synthase
MVITIRFDAIFLMVHHVAVKLAYDGREFNGSQRQPKVRTVEGEVLRALKKIGAIEGAKEARFRTASRTDAGVSALGNVICFDTDFDPGRLIHALNAVSEGVFYHGLALVDDDFSPRRARMRWYRYYHSTNGIDLGKFVACAHLFEGRHDFVRFCKPEGRATVKTVDRIDVRSVGDIIVIDLHAREFLRNMVRRMVAAMVEVGRGRASVDEVREVLEGRIGSFGLAKSEDLVLMDVRYMIEIPTIVTVPFRHEVRRRRQEALIELFFFDILSGPSLDLTKSDWTNEPDSMSGGS